MNLKRIPAYGMIVLIGILLILFSCGEPQQESAKQPNIIFIMSDDHAYQAISAYQDHLIQTPNIDRICGKVIWLVSKGKWLSILPLM